MDGDRVQRAVSADGTEVVARVSGNGPPLVLLPAGPADCETTWRFVLPILRQRFTCYLADTRGRGQSADSGDHSPPRLVEDVTALAESTGEPAGLVEWGTALWALVAAERLDAVAAVASYESGADEAMDEEIAARFEVVFPRAAELVAEGRFADAAGMFIEHGDVVYTEEDYANGVADLWTASIPNIPIFLDEQRQLGEAAGPGPTDPSTLARIAVPVLLLKGSRTKRWFSDSARHLAEHLPNATVRETADAGHFGPYEQPHAIADELTRFFGAVLQRP